MSVIDKYIEKANKEEKEIKAMLKIETVMIIIISIILIIMSFAAIKQNLELIAIEIENEKLSKCIEYQKSAIADLEDNLKNK